MKNHQALYNRSGVTLTELMITVSILSVAVLGLMATFGGIQKGIQTAKSRTIAANLCREKLEILKNHTYDRLLATRQTDLDTYGYDNTNFPPETALVSGGISFGRYVKIMKVHEDAGRNIVELSPATPDDGLKKIEVWSEWKEGTETKRYTMSSLRENPGRVSQNGSISGVVYKSPGGAGTELSAAAVLVLDNPNWTTQTGAAGAYSLKTSTGAHTLRASKRGYFQAQAGVTAAPNATQNFTLSPRGSAAVFGQAYTRDHLVISQIVTDTDTINSEYVELYNPTTWAWTISASTIKLLYIDKANNPPGSGNSVDITPAITFNAGSIAVNGYYLIASTDAIRVLGQTIAADATYSAGASPQYVLRKNEAGGVILQDGAGQALDRAAWSKTAGTAETAPALATEGSGLKLDQGINAGEQIVRWDHDGASVLVSTNGRSWDDNDNSNDFNKEVTGVAKDMTLKYAPKNTSSTNSPQTGTPAVGATISATDDLSSPTTLVSATGYFQLTGIATTTVAGTPSPWTISIASASLYISSANVSLTADEVRDLGTMALTQIAGDGIVTGTVLVSTGGALGNITVRSGGAEAVTNGAGAYQLILAPGTAITVTANPNNLNPNYTYANSASITLSAGKTVGGVDFTLDPGGKISGWVASNGVDPLANVPVKAEAPAGTERGTVVTNGSGNFVISNLPISSLAGVGAYTVSPVLDPSQASSPVSLPGTVTLGATVNVGTFTVTGSLGMVKGSVKDGGMPITTGVLILASTTTLVSDPPTWNEAIRSGPNLYYAGHSASSGDYLLRPRVSGTTYNVYAWYSKLSGEAFVTTRKSAVVTVANSTTTFTVNFEWP